MKAFFKLPVAHRGLHDETKPENSIAAFEAAIEAGYAIETDIRFSKDGTLAVFHDDNLERMTGDKRNVADCTMQELKALRLSGSDEQIPTFEEFLTAIGGRVPLLIEIKNMKKVKGKRVAGAIASVIDRLGYTGEYAIQSFHPFYVRAYRKLRPQIPCGVLAQREMSEKGDSLRWRIEAFLLSRLKLNFLAKPDFVSYGVGSLPQKCVSKFKGTKLGWTVRSPEEEARARKYVDNIIFEGYLPRK